jgi:uncharacterized membrane protein
MIGAPANDRRSYHFAVIDRGLGRFRAGLHDVMQAEEFIRTAVGWLRLSVEAIGALIIALGVLTALLQLVRFVADRSSRGHGFHAVRLQLARYLALALEFQLAADILSTAVAPSWEAIGKLAAIAVIRTALNFFLIREMEENVSSNESPARAATSSAR